MTPARPPRARAVRAHPDDAEFLCAGTLVRLAREHGYALHVATMTAGDCGSAELPPDAIAAVRKAEGAAAAAEVGATYHCLGELDLRVVYSGAAVEKAVRLINAVGATVLFTHAPDDYHLDHEQTSKIARAAAFAAPIPNFLHGRHDHPPLPAIPHVYYCDPLDGKDVFGKPVAPDFTIDITDALDAKSAMLSKHESQRAWLRHHHGVDNLVESMRTWSASRAGTPGRAAEGFRQHLGHSYPQDNLLVQLLGGRPVAPPLPHPPS
jgi:LmbE family N-acetylglucosaminyl deacetylase